MSDLEGKVNALAAKQAATDKKLTEQGKAVADLQRQLSKRCVIIQGPDVPAKQLRETEANNMEIFLSIANQGFKTIVAKHEMAACHRQGKVSVVNTSLDILLAPNCTYLSHYFRMGKTSLSSSPPELSAVPTAFSCRSQGTGGEPGQCPRSGSTRGRVWETKGS